MARTTVSLLEDVAEPMSKLAKIHRRSLTGELAAACDNWLGLHEKEMNDEHTKLDDPRARPRA